MTSKEVRMLWVQVMPAQVDIPSEAVFVRWGGISVHHLRCSAFGQEDETVNSAKAKRGGQFGCIGFVEQGTRKELGGV
jgi:hypothetical protein